MAKTKSFVKEVLARISGDDAGVKAQKIYRKGTSALNSQIAALKAKEVDDEANLDNAKDALKDAKFPKELFSSNSAYIDGIRRAQEEVDRREDALLDTRTSLAYFENMLKEFDAEVE